MLGEIADRVERLLVAGFENIGIVTDHGWLLMPGGLPKTELAASLAENAWGRCAALKPGAFTDKRLYPWYWNPHQEFALADGIRCYRAGMRYAHGGLSLQECLTLQLTISVDSATRSRSDTDFPGIVWKGLRCKSGSGRRKLMLCSLDMRTQAGNPATSIVMDPKPFKEDGTSSVVVKNEDLQGREATIVILDAEGHLVAQRLSVIAKERD